MHELLPMDPKYDPVLYLLAATAAASALLVVYIIV